MLQQAIEGPIQILFPKLIQNNSYCSLFFLVAMVHLSEGWTDAQTRPGRMCV